MKTILIIFFISLINLNGKGIITFENPKFHVKNIDKSGKIKHKFIFTNTSKSTIKIVDVKTSCTCTAPAWSVEGILPGKKGYVELSTTSEQLEAAMAVNAVIKINTREKQFYKVELIYD